MLEQARAGERPLAIHPLEYRAMEGAGIAAPESAEKPENPEKGEANMNAEHWEERLRALQIEMEERSRTYERELQAARVEACEAGRVSERNEQAMRLEAAGTALANALKAFARDRDRYLAQVEREVVKLALSIAARVLRRESLMDPLLLSGAVRVALGQLAETTEVRLKVPAADHAMWTEMLRLMPNLPLQPEVIADEALTTGDCQLESQMGSVDLGVKSQLAEIERGFFDLLERREMQGAGYGAQNAETPSPMQSQREERHGATSALAD